MYRERPVEGHEGAAGEQQGRPAGHARGRQRGNARWYACMGTCMGHGGHAWRRTCGRAYMRGHAKWLDRGWGEGPPQWASTRCRICVAVGPAQGTPSGHMGGLWGGNRAPWGHRVGTSGHRHQCIGRPCHLAASQVQGQVQAGHMAGARRGPAHSTSSQLEAIPRPELVTRTLRVALTLTLTVSGETCP